MTICDPTLPEESMGWAAQGDPPTLTSKFHHYIPVSRLSGHVTCYTDQMRQRFASSYPVLQLLLATDDEAQAVYLQRTRVEVAREATARARRTVLIRGREARRTDAGDLLQYPEGTGTS